MALISMCCHDTAENGRTEFTTRTLLSLLDTVDFNKHRLFIVDNNSCLLTKSLIASYAHLARIITLPENIGTAEALNLAWKERKPGEHCIKIDNDVVVNQSGWVDEMEEVVKRDPSIGQVGLKRKDLAENPWRNDWAKSEMEMLPHEPGQRWMIVEKVHHVMGTCVLHSSALLDKVGYLKQPGLYGFDDSLMSMRSRLSGFKNVFLSHINIDHIDPGGTDYTIWKQNYAAEYMSKQQDMVNKINSGELPIYYNPFV